MVAIVEVLVGVRCLGQRQAVRDDDRRISLALMNEVTETAVVGLHIALTGSHLLALEPELAHVECDLPFLRELIVGAGVLWDEDTNDADLSRRFDCIDQ